MLILKP